MIYTAFTWGFAIGCFGLGIYAPFRLYSDIRKAVVWLNALEWSDIYAHKNKRHTPTSNRQVQTIIDQN